MKQHLLLFLLLFCQLATAQKNKDESPYVNKNVELLCIVFRMAGNNEYRENPFKQYTDRVDKHFAAYQNHELIRFARILKREKGITYNAVVGMGVALDNGLNPLMDFSTELPEKRWTKDDAFKFIQLLKSFYQDADCDAFFKENESLYKDLANRFDTTYKALDKNWFQTFFGTKTDDRFHLLLSPGCGFHNYGPSYTDMKGKKEVFAILGSWKLDNSGMPVYMTDDYLPVMIHEFSHSYVNPIMAKQLSLFENSGKTIYKAQEYEMSKQQAYGDWGIMLNEALVRASVIKYFIDHGADESDITSKTTQEIHNGFIWIKGLVAELKKYDSQRPLYPTLESYLPQLATAYSTYANSIVQYDSIRPKVQSIREFPNFSSNVSPLLKTITIQFDQPLAGPGYSINYGSLGKSCFPQMDSIRYTDSRKAIVLDVRLQPKTTYQFILTGKNFKSEKGLGLKTYEVGFKTGE